MKLQFTLVLFSICIFSVTAQVVKEVEEVAPTIAHTKIEPKEHISIKLYKDVAYKKIQDKTLRLQVLRPIGNSLPDALPCIAHIKGSAWRKQDLYSNLPMLSRLAERGFVVIQIEYRPAESAPFPAQIEDSKTAIRFIRKNAEKLHVDPNNIFLWGGSSGGHTALMASFTGDELFCDTTFQGISSHTNATIAYYPPTDLTTMYKQPCTWDHNAADGAVGVLLGRKEVSKNLQLAKEASPISYVNKKNPITPTLIMGGTKDQIVPFKQCEQIVEALRKAQKDVEFYVIPGAGHGDWRFSTKETYDAIELFVRKHMVKNQ